MNRLAERSRGDVRSGERWSLLQRVKNDSLWLAIEAALQLAWLPESALVALGRQLGKVVHRGSPTLRTIAESQLSCAMPEMNARRLARRNFEDLGALLGQSLSALRTGTRPLPFPDQEQETLERARRESGGAGVVLASAHLGPFERVATTLAQATDFAAVGRESYDPRLMRIYERLRRYEIVYRGMPGAGVRMMRVLKAGRVLGIPMDLRTRAPSLLSPLLGRPAPTASGPARLALRARASVVVATAAPGSRAGEPIVVTVSRITTDDLAGDDTDAQRLTDRINAALDERIRALPTMWPWMHRRF